MFIKQLKSTFLYRKLRYSFFIYSNRCVFLKASLILVSYSDYVFTSDYFFKKFS